MPSASTCDSGPVPKWALWDTDGSDVEQSCEPGDAALLDAALLDLPLPALLDVDEDDEAVVISRWAGPLWDALLHVINNGCDEELGEVTVGLDATSFRRVSGGWQESRSGGGGSWWTTERPVLRRCEVPPRSWQLRHFHFGRDDDWHAPWAYAVGGTEAAWVEVTDIDGTVHRPVEAPLGYFVVAWKRGWTGGSRGSRRAGSSLGRRSSPRPLGDT